MSAAQTSVTYHLHNEPSTINAAKQLKPAGPDVPTVFLRSPDLKNSSGNFFQVLSYFETQTGEPNVAGIIPAGSVVTFSFWLRKTTVDGVFHPAAVLHFNQYWGPVPGLCAQGAEPNSPLPKLTTTLTKYTLTCTIVQDRTMASSDRFYVQIGAWVDAGPGKKSVQLELALEGTLNGNYDSTLIAPLPQRPTITSLAPSTGIVGQSVTIQGTGFGATQNGSIVTFNGTAASISSWSATSVTATVPAAATSGPVIVTVGQPSNPSPFTVIPPPAITGLTPTSGIVGQAITIAGTAFGATQGTSTVKFNGVAASASSWSNTSIVASVPAGTTSGPVVVSVNGQSSGGVAFTVVPPPAITLVSPSTGIRGQAVTVTGSAFGATQGTSTITFNGAAASVNAWSDTSITAVVPPAATSGAVVVSVNGQASIGVSFTVIPPPAITSLTPATGIAAQAVTIAGTAFGATQGTSTVTFNGLAAAVAAWSATSITTSVPAGAATGPVVVTVNGQSSNGLTFTIIPPPSIASLNPAGGLAGQPVTVTGSDFGTTQGSSGVTFSDAAATVTSWSATSITVTAPAGVVTGPVVVTVGGQVSNGMTFTVTPAPAIATVSPGGGMVGQPVSIAGNNFGAAQGSSSVTFNGVPASPSAWSNTSIQTTVPAAATSGGVVVTVGGQASNSVAFTVNSSTFEVTGYTPASGAVGVLTTPITATFGSAADPATITSATVRLLDADGVAVDAMLTYDVATRTVTLAPVNGLTPMQIYTVHVAGGSVGVLGADGVALAADAEWTFRSAAGPLTPSAAYHFSEMEGTTTSDASGNGNAAVVSGAQWTVNGRSGSGLTFDGSSPQLVEIPSSETLRLPDTFTWQLWVRPSATGAPRELIGRQDNGNDVSLQLDVNLVPTFAGIFTSGPHTLSAPAPIPADGWTHVAVTFDGEYLRLFVNAVEVAAVEATGGLLPSMTPWRIGGVEGSRFAGTLDEVRIYRIALVSRELDADMSTTTAAPRVTAMSPSSVVAGDTLVITGTNFGPAQGSSTVEINGLTAQVTSWSDTRIDVRVPQISSGGALTVTVTVDGEQAPCDDPNLPTGKPKPTISSLDPTAGFVGQKVTIDGNNLGATQASSSLRFNGTPATPTSWSNTRIETTVPEGLTTGPVVVTVDGVASNGVTFSKTGSTSKGGRSTVTIWHTETGVNADIGTWDGSPEVDGCTFFYVDIDVPQGGGSLKFTYNQRKQYVPVNDWLDVYLLTPGTVWDPGDIWSEDGTIRCQTQNYPAGVVPLIEDFLWQYTPGETADYQFDERLDEYQGQKVRIVFRQWFDGYPGDDTQTRIRDLTFTPLKFVIDKPVAASQHPLSQDDSRKTEPIEFKIASDAQTGVVTWSASREYTTTGGVSATPNPVVQSFQTQPGASSMRTYEGEGGEVTVTASSTVNGAQLEAGPSKFYVVGVPIDDAVITARLLALYSGGATPGLLKGICYVESTYRQFTATKHPSYNGAQPLMLPVENFATKTVPRGRYIGLMMTPFSTATAWDWYENTLKGLQVLQEHLRIAEVVENRIRAKFLNLPALTGEQRENMALAGYSGNVQPLTNELRQYYIPSADGLRWEPNPAQTGGIAYAKKVRDNINQR